METATTVSQEERAYSQALNEIYRRTEDGEHTISERILEPILQASYDTYELSRHNDSEYNYNAVTELTYAALTRLRDESELDPDDEISVAQVASDESDEVYAACLYTDGSGNEYVIDPVLGYAGLRSEAPALYVAAELTSRDDEEHDHGQVEVEIFNSSNRHTFEDIFEAHGSIDGDSELEPSDLIEIGLGPKYQVNVDKSTDIIFSDVYSYGGRLAVVGYVAKHQDDGEVLNSMVARTFYMSNSQGMWKYLPSHDNKKSYSNGHELDGLPLPYLAQAALSQISQLHHAKIDNPDIPFFGTARDISRAPGETLLLEAERNPKVLDGTFYPKDRTAGIIAPELMDFRNNSPQQPDFDREPVFSWQADTKFEKDVEFEVFDSKDGQLSYVFARTKDKRVWISLVEDNTSEVESTGIKKSWVKSGDLTMSIAENRGHAGNYGVPSYKYGVRYVDMWPKYLSKVPVVQRYLASGTNGLGKLNGVDTTSFLNSNAS